MSANLPRDTKSFLTWLTRGGRQTLQVIRKNFFPEEFPRNHKSVE